MLNKNTETKQALKAKEPQFNHVICAYDYKTGKPRMFEFLAHNDKYLLVKEIKLKYEKSKV